MGSGDCGAATDGVAAVSPAAATASAAAAHRRIRRDIFMAPSQDSKVGSMAANNRKNKLQMT